MLNPITIVPNTPKSSDLHLDLLAALAESEPKVGFSTRNATLYFGEKGEAGIVEERVSGQIEKLALTKNEAGEWGELVRFNDPDGNAVEKIIPMRMFESDGKDVRQMLRDAGLSIEPASSAKQRLLLYLQSNLPQARARVVSRIGWHDDTFVLPDAAIGRTADRTICQVGRHAYNVCGSLEPWKENVARYCVGNSRATLAVSTAFAAALLKRSGSESGGFQFRGPSSNGKTTLLEVAGSVWGGSEHGFIDSWRQTANGLEATALRHNDALLCLDEMGQVRSSDVGEAAYMLANGKSKGRMNKDATAKDAPTWRLLFLSSGEISLADHMREAGKRVRGGQQTRLVDIPADAGAGLGAFEELHGFADGGAFSRHFESASRQYYGSAIRAFIEAVLERSPEMKECIAVERSKILEGRLACGEEVGRVADRFALVAAAGELATSYGITGWPEGEARNGAKACFNAWLGQRGHGAADAQAAVAQIRLFLQQHEARFAGAVDQYDQSGTHNRVGFIRNVDGHLEYCCFVETFKAVICEGYDHQMAARALKARGYLMTDGDRLTVKRTIPNTKSNPRMYVIKSSILDGDPEAL